MEIELDVETLKRHLLYEPETGSFIRLIGNTGKCKVGQVAGWRTVLGYIDIKVRGIRYKAHRLAWLYMTGRLPIGDLDHANMIRHDNRFANLREATRSQNQSNRDKLSSNKSGFKGVNYHKASKKYAAQCSVNGKKKYLGIYDTPEQASAAYSAFSQAHYREFSRS